MSGECNFHVFPHGHQDLVLAADYNFYGTRLVTASSDHRLKVWDKKRDTTWELVDSWRAHDAEITDVRWNGPFAGQVLGSIGEDGFFKLWQEDVTQAPNSGRRFKSVAHPVAAKSKLPWMSLDFKNLNSETYLALVTRDGSLSVMEPKDHDNLGGDWIDWMENQNFQVCAVPQRAEEASFKVRFHSDSLPCWTAIVAGLDRKALSLAVAAMRTVKIYRTDKDKRLYLAVELTGAKSLVRDVAWAPGSARGFDIVGTAGKDGVVRIYEVKTPATKACVQVGTTAVTQTAAVDAGGQNTVQARAKRSTVSGIGAGLAGAATAYDDRIDDSGNPSRVKHTVELVAELMGHRGAVWRVSFSSTGDVLASTGDDGTVRTWKKGINNTWFEFAEIDIKGFR